MQPRLCLLVIVLCGLWSPTLEAIQSDPSPPGSSFHRRQQYRENLKNQMLNSCSAKFSETILRVGRLWWHTWPAIASAALVAANLYYLRVHWGRQERIADYYAALAEMAAEAKAQAEAAAAITTQVAATTEEEEGGGGGSGWFGVLAGIVILLVTVVTVWYWCKRKADVKGTKVVEDLKTITVDHADGDETRSMRKTSSLGSHGP